MGAIVLLFLDPLQVKINYGVCFPSFINRSFVSSSLLLGVFFLLRKGEGG